ncbi:MAG: PSD1 and planctomycete cytochrome C domain-containing protein [Pirellulales bacterium]|nr:PSD1 and planctomycete cytochrome C domain-containing protein [Pirellulales bacterium]
MCHRALKQSRKDAWRASGFVLVALCLTSCCRFAVAAEAPEHTPPTADFDRHVRPILASRCYECHGESAQEGGLRLDDAAGILKGGESGEPVFVRGSSADSLLIKRLTLADPKDRMPLDAEPLSSEQIALLTAWIDAGGKIPGDDKAAAALKLTTDHWSFQPLKRPAVPMSGNGFVCNPIDEFVLAKLRERNLAPSEPADRRTLIRRLYLVAHGLPPTPDEVQAFVDDSRPDAFARLVNRVLDSPRYGERWARHWMDVVRYADTNGFETNRQRKTAWVYRDWIIASLNADKPYDQFIREQLAGDASGADAATGFLVAGAYDVVKAPDINLTLAQRQDELADMVNTTGTAFMGLTMGCARCHNHKFDPILQRDYYAMQAVFAGVQHGERALRTAPDEVVVEQLAQLRAEESKKQAALERLADKVSATTIEVDKKLRPPVNPRLNEEHFAPTDALSVRFTITACNSGNEPCIDELEVFDSSGRNVALASAGGKPSVSGTLAGYEIHQLDHLNDAQVGNDHSWISNTANSGWARIDFPEHVRIERVVWGRDRGQRFNDRLPTQYVVEVATEPDKWVTVASSLDRRPFSEVQDRHAWLAKLGPDDAVTARRLQQELEAIEHCIADLSGTQTGWVGTFQQPEKTHRLYRGEPMQRREVVAPDAINVIGTLGMAVDEPEQQRRIKLANWIASHDHPLTARVMVNRLWHYTFGQGIVDTPSDFGHNGGRPTHPELLDWLADELMASGWSIKHVLRLVLTSATFQQSSAPRPEALTIDADGRYLWRYSPRRLEAEAIRDSMLAISGALDLSMGGPGFYLMDVVEENVMHYFPKEKFTPAEFRRMVYLFRIRQATDSVFGSFDCPDGGQAMAKRSRSNTPLQALNLFNSSFVLQQSEILAERVRQSVGDSPEAQVQWAFAHFYARPPDDYELEQSVQLIREQGLTSFCRALFNSSEFLFVF